MAARAAGAGRSRRGPAPIASFDHDVSDESSPETKQSVQLPEIREDPGAGDCLAPPAGRARSHSSPGLQAPPAPRIDISRASSSSHQDSRDSSPELALFDQGGAGVGGHAPAGLGFREDGALDLRSSTEELAFLEGAPGGAPAPPAPPAAPPPAPRRHSRKDSQGSEAALLAVSGRTSRLSSVGSQCSAHSALSRVSRLSVASGVSRSPSPHKMLLETSFCGPRPIDTDPEICTADVEHRLLELAAPPAPPAAPADARDRREVRTEVTVETHQPAAARATPSAPPVTPTPLDDDKRQKESQNEARVEQRRARSRDRRPPAQPAPPEVYQDRNRSKDIIRIKLRPDDDDDDDAPAERAARPTALAPSPAPSPPTTRRTPSPAGPVPSRKSSFCSLFKSRETIGSPESPSEALRRKKSLTEGRDRSKSRERGGTAPSAGGKLRGSVLALFKTPRRSAASPSPSSRAPSPPATAPVPAAAPCSRADKLKYYEDGQGGVIHIPLHTPPDERPGATPRPASAPTPRLPTQRTVLPDGSIIIPLHSPTERTPADTTSRVSTPPPEPRSDDPSPVPRCVSAVVEPLPAEPREPPAPAQQSPGPTAPSAPRSPDPPSEARPRRKERLVFTTHVGSTEQVFSTQLSITKTPSLTSDMSDSLPSFPDDPRPLRDTHIASGEPPSIPTEQALTPHSARDSSESEGSSEAALGAGDSVGGGDGEARGLVVQESFEDELPYVPTTLPLERSLALPMVPVRERTPQRPALAAVERPRAPVARSAGPLRAPATPQAPTTQDKLLIKLPRRPRAAPTPQDTPTTSTTTTTIAGEGEGHRQPSWIDFEEVPERRKQPKRIQTLPARGRGPSSPGSPAAPASPVFSYVEPDECRCECHTHPPPSSGPQDDELPLLDATGRARVSLSSPEGAEELGARLQLSVQIARPFTGDLGLRAPPTGGRECGDGARH